MSYGLSRTALRRTAILFAAAAGPLLGAGSAQAAIAGAQPEKATVIPVLASATIDATTRNAVDVCFDKAVLPGTAKRNFGLSGYRVSVYENASSVASLSADCVKASFGVANLTPYTILDAYPGAVTSAGGSNHDDTVALQGSTSHAGTRNVVAGPNLAGVAPSTATSAGNQYIFTFDKDVVAPTAAQATNFYIVGADGQETDGQSATPVASNAIAVTFAVADAKGQSTASAFLGGVRGDGTTAGGGGNPQNSAVVSQYDNSSSNVSQSAQIPYATTPPSEFAPYLISATLNPENATTGAESVTYTFSQGVNPCTGSGATATSCPNGGPTPGDFYLELASGAVLPADNVVTQAAGPTTTVTANFSTGNRSGLPFTSEFGVVAFADTGAVTTYSTNNTGIASAASSAAIGGNPGAFGEGFTTAPDVTGITIAHDANGGANDVLTINLDDRTIGGAASVSDRTVTNPDAILYQGFAYFDSTGAPLTSTAPAAPSCGVTQGTSSYPSSTPAPGPETVTCLYPPNALNGVASIGFGFGTFIATMDTGNQNTPDFTSVPQIVSPISTSAIVRAYRINVAHMKAKHHRARHHAKRTRKR